MVKWISPALSDHQLLERLRNTGLFIPAGTHVRPGFGRVRILEFSRASDVTHLVATKGAVLRDHKDISINPAKTARHLSYSEQQAISRCRSGQQH
jgi:hypothetical protein